MSGRGRRLLISVLLSRKVFETYLLSPFQLVHIMHQYFSHSIPDLSPSLHCTASVQTTYRHNRLRRTHAFSIITLQTKSEKQSTIVSHINPFERLQDTLAKVCHHWYLVSVPFSCLVCILTIAAEAEIHLSILILIHRTFVA